ncbi:hypothetical protein FHX08_000025 [Rhizobium sp. BK529]|nr:hypothetical protein [Rhizobium sp. BK529]TCS04351.1 hypothetical protein EV281_10324 [Rhizobium sp. BK418]
MSPFHGGRMSTADTFMGVRYCKLRRKVEEKRKWQRIYGNVLPSCPCHFTIDGTNRSPDLQWLRKKTSGGTVRKLHSVRSIVGGGQGGTRTRILSDPRFHATERQRVILRFVTGILSIQKPSTFTGGRAPPSEVIVRSDRDGSSGNPNHAFGCRVRSCASPNASHAIVTSGV